MTKDHGYRLSRDEESRSSSNVACGALRKMEAGQAVEIGPSKAAVIGLDLRSSGARHSSFFAESSSGIVRVKA